MAKALPQSGQQENKFGDLWRRLVFLLLALIVYRIGSHIPVPGIDPDGLQKLFDSQKSGLLGLFNMFSGGALERFAIFALGITPYISASIIVQLMTYVYPPLEALKKEGEAGRRKISQYTRYAALLLAFVQAFGIANFLQSSPDLVINPGIGFQISTVVSLTAGTMFLMWLGEQITERGLGNGISILIFAGIVAGLPGAVSNLLTMAGNGTMKPLLVLFILLVVVAVTYFVIFVENGQRKIPVNYARRQMGNKMYSAPPSHLPLKLNMAGVIPPIFASSLLLLPATLANWVSSYPSLSWLRNVSDALMPGRPEHMILFAVAIIFFCFFYTGMVFNSRQTADDLKKSGAFVPGIGPGENTARYFDGILMKLTLIGAFYISLICLVPEFLHLMHSNIPFYFGGTSLLIIVVVAMDFMAQVQNYMMSQKYDTLLKKASFK